MAKKQDGRLYQNIIWKSRRGMLELDLLLEPFVNQIYPQLNPYQQRTYDRLLLQEDTTLYKWLVLAKPPEYEFEEIVALIRQDVQKTGY